MNYNLLTEETKKKNDIEYQLKELSVIFYFLSGILLSGAILLLPSFFLLETRKDSANLVIENSNPDAEKSERGKFAMTLREIEESMKLISVENNLNNSASILISRIIESKNESVTLSRFVYSIEGASSTIMVEGLAKNRDSFLSFADTVKKTKPFSVAEYPVDLIAKNRDIKFTMTIK